MHDVRALGVAPGTVLMLHASVRSIGWVVGGPDVVLDALVEALGPTGTLMMYVGCRLVPSRGSLAAVSAATRAPQAACHRG